MISTPKRIGKQVEYGSKEHQEIQYLLQQDFQQKLKLQGQKKVVEFEMLQLSILKMVFLGIPLMLSIVGLYCLLKNQKFRLAVLFNSHQEFDPQKITHLRITKNDNSAEIVSLNKEQFMGSVHYTFTTQLLKYEISKRGVCPVASHQIPRLSQCIGREISPELGLTTEQCQERLLFYGPNQHKVQMPGYLFYMIEILTEPLFVLQYCIFAVWIIRYLFTNVAVNLLFCLAVTSVNYLILYHNFNKVKQIAERTFSLKVLRNGEDVSILNSEIVPGDIYVVENEIPCDSVVMSGDLLVNEVNFTGENLPILKYKIQNLSNLKNSHHWIFQGSEVLSARGEPVAMAIHSGYTSHRGRIIRKIIKHNVQQPIFTHHVLIFFVLAYILAGMVYFSYISKLISLPIRQDTIVFLFFEIVSLAVPVGYVGVVNLLPGLSLIRLDLQDIYGKQPYKVYDVAQLDTICFDKTGTLTKNSLELADVYLCEARGHSKITGRLEQFNLVFNLFASCHMIKQISPQNFAGDQIDLKMFLRTNSSILNVDSSNLLWEIVTNSQTLQILRVNQFQSKHMSMSVLIRQKRTKSLFVFVKGSPELIYRHCVEKPTNWLELTKQLSFEGFRTIGMAFKRVKHQQQEYYRRAQREAFLENISVLGIVSFVNKLKQDANQVVQRLKLEVGVDVKMITGDNIYTAVQTAFKSGIIAQHESVAICEEKHIMDRESLKTKLIVISQNGKGQFSESQRVIDSFEQYVLKAEQSMVFALQNAFIKDFLFQNQSVRKIRVFARVSPENKIQIIKSIKQNLQNQYQNSSRFDKLFDNFTKKVCMVGDGANDLMAIKEADVGIGIRQSDGTFSADFVVSTLSQLEQLIRQGKSISKTAIETFLIYFLNTSLYIPLMLLTVHDLCTFSEETMFYKNIGFNIFLPFMFGLSQPLRRNSRSSPQMNVLSVQNQLKIWTNILIFSLGFCLCFQYYWRSDDVELINRGWVTMTDSFTTYSKSSTLCFKIIIAHCPAVIFNIYSGAPWKQPITKNYVLMGWMLLNLLVGTVAYFGQKVLGFLKLAPMKTKTSYVVLTIMILTSAVSMLATNLIDNHYRNSHTKTTDDV